MKILNIFAAAAIGLAALGASTSATAQAHESRAGKLLDRADPPGPDIEQRDEDRAAGLAGRKLGTQLKQKVQRQNALPTCSRTVTDKCIQRAARRRR